MQIRPNVTLAESRFGRSDRPTAINITKPKSALCSFRTWALLVRPSVKLQLCNHTNPGYELYKLVKFTTLTFGAHNLGISMGSDALVLEQQQLFRS